MFEIWAGFERPGGFESLLLRIIEMCPKRKKPHCWGFTI